MAIYQMDTFHQLMYLEALKRYKESDDLILETLVEKTKEYEEAKRGYCILFQNVIRLATCSFNLTSITKFSVHFNNDIPNAIVQENTEKNFLKIFRKPLYYAYMTIDQAFLRNFFNNLNFDGDAKNIKIASNYITSNKKLVQNMIDDLKNSETISKLIIPTAIDFMLTYFDNN